MIRKAILLTGSLLLAIAALHAAPRTAEQMRQVAADALAHSGVMARVKGHQAALREMKRTDDYAVWGFEQGGFAVVAVDDRMPGL